MEIFIVDNRTENIYYIRIVSMSIKALTVRPLLLNVDVLDGISGFNKFLIESLKGATVEKVRKTLEVN